MSNYTVTGENFKRFLDLTVKHDGSVRDRWHALIVYGLVCYSGEGVTPNGGKPNKGDPGILTDLVSKMASCKAQGINNVKEWVKAHSALTWNDTKNGFVTRQKEEKGTITLPTSDDDRYWAMGKKGGGGAKAISPLDRLAKVSAAMKLILDGNEKAPELKIEEIEEIEKAARTLVDRAGLVLHKMKMDSLASDGHAADLAASQRESAISTAIAHIVKHGALPPWFVEKFDDGLDEGEARDIQGAMELTTTRLQAEQAKRLADIERAKEIVTAEPKPAPVAKPRRRSRIVTHKGVQSVAALATNPDAKPIKLPTVA